MSTTPKKITQSQGEAERDAVIKAIFKAAEGMNSGSVISACLTAVTISASYCSPAEASQIAEMMREAADKLFKKAMQLKAQVTGKQEVQ